ncbi:hypothetical protein CRENBAI_010317, partial [Crenichthys baileyi]
MVHVVGNLEPPSSLLKVNCSSPAKIIWLQDSYISLKTASTLEINPPQASPQNQAAPSPCLVAHPTSSRAPPNLKNGSLLGECQTTQPPRNLFLLPET